MADHTRIASGVTTTPAQREAPASLWYCDACAKQTAIELVADVPVCEECHTLIDFHVAPTAPVAPAPRARCKHGTLDPDNPHDPCIPCETQRRARASTARPPGA